MRQACYAWRRDNFNVVILNSDSIFGGEKLTLLCREEKMENRQSTGNILAVTLSKQIKIKPTRYRMKYVSNSRLTPESNREV